jgi:hypothetical protein
LDAQVDGFVVVAPGIETGGNCDDIDDLRAPARIVANCPVRPYCLGTGWANNREIREGN